MIDLKKLVICLIAMMGVLNVSAQKLNDPIFAEQIGVLVEYIWPAPQFLLPLPKNYKLLHEYEEDCFIIHGLGRCTDRTGR